MNAFSVVLPVYNEGSALRPSLERLHAHLTGLRGSYRYELIVVDDGSQDMTAAVVETFRRERPGSLRFLRHGRRLGFVSALRTGLDAARMLNVIVADVEIGNAPEAIDALAAELFKTSAACVLASPYARGGRISRIPIGRRIADAAKNRLLSACLRGRLSTLTFALRAYDGKVLAALLERFRDGEFNSWAVAELLRERLTVREVPVRLAGPRTGRKTPGRLSYLELWRGAKGLWRSASLLRRVDPPALAGAAATTTTASAGTYGPY
jgi:glycosyltransferase involved in cell wall biosynthesis